jgi:soluble lytic murein transglycosylase
LTWSIFRASLLLTLLLSLSCSSRAQSQTPADFYQGLLSRDAQSAQSFFEKALNAPNAYIRQAAAERLAITMYEGGELSAKTTEQVVKEASGSWAEAFAAAGKAPDMEKALQFLLKPRQAGGGGGPPNEAALYVYRECVENNESFFSSLETAAINAHFAISRSRYREALFFFRAFQEDNKWPARPPALFVQYPDLINDLGRAFQYGTSAGEGIDLFLQWEKTFSSRGTSDKSPRFRLLFYAARIARQRGQANAPELFERALPLAPDAEQKDAAIWYVLDITLNGGAGPAIQKLGRLAPQWRDGAYFDDILEKLSRELAAKRDWKALIKVFTFVRNRGAPVSTARYAWIIGRLVQEGLLSPEEIRLARAAANARPQNVFSRSGPTLPQLGDLSADFMRAAYEAGDTSLYYRYLSAAALEKPFLNLNPDDKPLVTKENEGKPSDALEFLLGFFSNGAAEFSLPYIKSMEKEFSTDELRTLAEALGKAEMHSESMRLVSLYLNKENYKPGKRDMELWFPRPYGDLVRKYAEETGVSQSLLYGLIRTESAFQSSAVSHAGAAGLTQLMPATAEEMAARILKEGGPDYTAAAGGVATGVNLKDPAANIHIGAYYLMFLMTRFEEDTLLSLLAYNGGMNRIRRWKAATALPTDLFLETVSLSETREYGRKVTAAAEVYRQLYE